MKTKHINKLNKFIVISVFFLFACTKKKNSLSEFDLKGNVKSIHEISYIANEKFGEIIKGDKERGEQHESDYFACFNIDGNLTEMKFYKSDDKFSSKQVFRYDSKGKQEETKSYNAEGKFAWKNLFKYDTKGNRIEKKDYYQDTLTYEKTNYIHDKKGNIIEENFYNMDGVRSSNAISQYDKKGNLIKWIRSYRSDWEKKTIVNYIYDSDGNIKEKSICDSDEKMMYLFRYEYDKNRNETNISRINSDGTKGEIIDYKYFYDNQQNWIKRIEFQNDIPKYIIEREIEYYK